MSLDRADGVISRGTMMGRRKRGAGSKERDLEVKQMKVMTETSEGGDGEQRVEMKGLGGRTTPASYLELAQGEVVR